MLRRPKNTKGEIIAGEYANKTEMDPTNQHWPGENKSIMDCSPMPNYWAVYKTAKS